MTDETPIDGPVHQSGAGNLPEFSVSEISRLLKRTVEEAFPYVRIRGEVSRVNRHSSGHCYFDLKDEKALIASVVWKGNFSKLAVKPEQGLEVVCTGRVTTFQGQSKYQIVVEQMELAGLGALMAMLEERKKRLAGEGLFDEARKKPIPFLPETVGVVTSPTGAVIRDIMHRLADRFPRRVLLWPVSVQGERAPAEIVSAIEGFNALKQNGPLPRPDVLIIARGGGSFEDLLAFSDEAVVRAAANSDIPLISAVGHETDTTLIDYVSDKRAPTPTAAAEMAVPVLRDLLGSLLDLQGRLHRGVTREMERRGQDLAGLARALPRADTLLAFARQRFDNTSERLRGALFQNLQRHDARLARSGALLRPRVVGSEIAKRRDHIVKLDARLRRAYGHGVGGAAHKLSGVARIMESVSYRAVLERGFALIKGADGTVRRRASTVQSGEVLQLSFADGPLSATADGKAKIQETKTRARPKPSRPPQGDLF
jgi:exodeoxyribonuclease VII large subunit